MTGAREQQEVAVAFNEMTDRLEQVLEAQREFVGNASHQLRTPLTGLRLRLEAAGLKSDDPAVQQELELAEAEVERLTRLLNSLLTLARDGDRPALRAPVSLRSASESAYERWLPRAEASGYRLALDGAGDAFVRAADEDVAITLDNLIENALVYAPPGTTVTVTGSERTPGRPRRRPGRAAGRGAARLRALPARPHGPARHRPRPCDRRGAGAPLGRLGVDQRPRRRHRHARGGRPAPGGDELMRTMLLGLLGLALAVTVVGLGVHLVTRNTISLPVVQLEPAPAAPPTATTTDDTTTDRIETERETNPVLTTEPAPAALESANRDRDGRGQLGPRAGERPLRRRFRQQ